MRQMHGADDAGSRYKSDAMEQRKGRDMRNDERDARARYGVAVPPQKRVKNEKNWNSGRPNQKFFWNCQTAEDFN